MLKLKVSLFLQQIVDDILAVAPEVREYEGDMHPVGAALVVLPDELVEGQVVFDIVKNPLAKLHVAIDTDVNGLTLQVLRIIDSAHGFVQLLTAITTTDLDRSIHCHAQGFEHVGSEIHEVDHFLHAGGVVDAKAFGSLAGV